MATQRNLALDRYRGLAIVFMVLVNSLEDVARVPAWLKHAPDAGFTFADIVAPMFLFAVAATYRQSFLRRAEKGGAYGQFAGRYFAIVGVGTIFSAGGIAGDWGVLQAIGAAGLLTLLVIRLPALARAAIGCGVLLAYQLACNFVPALRDMVFEGDHGGFIGAVSWGAMLIIATAVIDLYNRGAKPFLLGTGALSALAAGALFLAPVSKNRVSASYVLACVAACAVLYFAMDLISKRLPFKSGVVIWWGENPLLLYILHLMLVGLARAPFGFEEKPLLPGLLATAAMLAGMSLVAWALHRKGKRVSL
ncbi:MAG: DUF5009 domain-containing protein [Oscillospiraceae bacterium]|jgi:predicted acyltransferase|nr:DUF5009 domain-containing protein [Oscillospiraceae bacterium]